MKDRIITFFQSLRVVMKFSVTNPKNFEEVFSFQSTWQRVLSLVLLVILFFSGLTFYLFVLGPFSGSYGAGTNDVSIERKKLESQAKEIQVLQNKILALEGYADRLLKLTRGELPMDMAVDSNVQAPNIDFNKIDPSMSAEELSLMEEVRNDLRTQSDQDEVQLHTFYAPVKGTISQGYSSNHKAIDVVVKEGTDVLACQSGTIIYSGFTHSDGFVIILDHGNEYVSIYKHNKLLIRKTGDRVQMGELIAKAGTSGENSSGPHLHFELFYNGKAQDPTKLMSFTH